MLFLIVDDDPNVQELIKLYLNKEGFQSITAETGEKALAEVKKQQPSFIILDIMLPGIEGWEVLERLRRQNINTPVIMLSAKGQEYDRVKGLELGADDYITKPFSPLELIARIKAVIRRVDPQDETEIIIDGLQINIPRHLVLLDDVQIDLTPKEFDLLTFLAQNPHQVFSREKLLEKVWGYDYPGDLRTVDVHIKCLRKKLPSQGKKWSLQTVWGVGYKFEVEQ